MLSSDCWFSGLMVVNASPSFAEIKVRHGHGIEKRVNVKIFKRAGCDVAHAFHLSTPEAEAGGALNVRTARIA